MAKRFSKQMVRGMIEKRRNERRHAERAEAAVEQARWAAISVGPGTPFGPLLINGEEVVSQPVVTFPEQALEVPGGD